MDPKELFKFMKHDDIEAYISMDICDLKTRLIYMDKNYLYGLYFIIPNRNIQETIMSIIHPYLDDRQIIQMTKLPRSTGNLGIQTVEQSVLRNRKTKAIQQIKPEELKKENIGASIQTKTTTIIHQKYLIRKMSEHANKTLHIRQIGEMFFPDCKKSSFYKRLSQNLRLLVLKGKLIQPCKGCYKFLNPL